MRRFYIKTGILILVTLTLAAAAREILEIKKYREMVIKPLEQEYPEINNSDVTKFEKVNMMREFVYRSSVFADSPGMCLDLNEYIKRDKDEKRQAEILLSTVRDRSGGFYCAGFATMLTLLYRTMGYEAVNLTMAVGGDNSHVLTLVKIGDQWIAEDATFNQVYVNQYGIPLDIKEIISHLKSGEDEKIHIEEGEYKYRFAISQNSPEEWNSLYPFIEILEADDEKGRYFYVIDGTRKYYEPMDQLLRDALGREGYPANEKYLFLYSRVTGTGGETREYELSLQEELENLLKE